MFLKYYLSSSSLGVLENYSLNLHELYILNFIDKINNKENKTDLAKRYISKLPLFYTM